MKLSEWGLAGILALSGCAEMHQDETVLEARLNYYEEGLICKEEALKPENENRKNDLLGQAFNCFETAKRNKPEEAHLATIEQAKVLSEMGDWLEALSYAKDAVVMKKCAETLNGKGYIETKHQFYDMAINDYSEAIKIEDNETSRWGRYNAYMFAAVTQNNSEYLKDAIKDAKKCAEFTEQPDAYVAIGMAELLLANNSGKYKARAYESFKTAIEMLDKGKKLERFKENEVRNVWNKMNDSPEKS